MSATPYRETKIWKDEPLVSSTVQYFYYLLHVQIVVPHDWPFQLVSTLHDSMSKYVLYNFPHVFNICMYAYSP